MSVDNIGDTELRKNTYNGAADPRNTHSPTKSYTQLNQSQTDSQSGPDWDAPSPIASPTPGTPRIIRRVDSITAVYAPDKDARAASRERLRVSSPVAQPMEAVIHVVRSPDREMNGQVESSTKRHSVEFYTPSAFKDSDNGDDENRQSDDLSDNDSAVDVSPPSHRRTHRLPHRSSPEQTSFLTADMSTERNEMDTDQSPTRASVNAGPQPTGDSSGTWKTPQRDNSGTIESRTTWQSPNEDVVQGQTDDDITTATLVVQPHVVPDVAAPEESPLDYNPELIEASETISDPPESAKVMSTKHQSTSKSPLGDSHGSAFHSVVPRDATPPAEESLSIQSIPLSEQGINVSSDSRLFNDVLVSRSDLPIESLTEAGGASLSCNPLFAPSEEEEREDGGAESHILSHDHPQVADSVQVTPTAVPAYQSVQLPSSPSFSEITPQLVEHMNSQKQSHTDANPTPNLASIADHVNSPDPELQAMLSPSVLQTRSDPATNLCLSRYSPAELVKVTGGASLEIMRNIEADEEVSLTGNQTAGDTTEVPPTSAPPVSTSSWSSSGRPTRSGTTFGRRRMSAPDTDLGGSSSVLPVINIQVKVDAQLKPSTPEEVDASSKIIFGNFIAERYKLEVTASAKLSTGADTSSASASASVDQSGASTSKASASVAATHRPSQDDIFGTDFASIPRPNPDSMEAAVARNLAQIGDEISRQYGRQLDRMIKLLPGDECPVDVFTNVARALFNRGPTNWGQIVTLFYFGYRLVVRRVRSGVVNAFSQVCQCLISFCRQLNIFAWIAQRGGWLILKYLRLSGTSEAVPDEENPDEQDGPAGVLTSITPGNEGHDMPGSSNPWLGTFLVVSSGIAMACVALFLYRRLN